MTNVKYIQYRFAWERFQKSKQSHSYKMRVLTLGGHCIFYCQFDWDHFNRTKETNLLRKSLLEIWACVSNTPGYDHIISKSMQSVASDSFLFPLALDDITESSILDVY